MREYVLAHDGLVGSHGNARIALYESAHLAQTVLADACVKMELVLEYGLHTRKRSVAAALAKTVYRYVESACTIAHGSKGVAHGKVVVVVGVKVEMGRWITLGHLLEELCHLHGVEDAERVGQEKTPDTALHERVHHLIDIGGRVLHATAPVLKIEVDSHALLRRIGQGAVDVVDVLLGGLLELLGAMLERTLGKEVHHTAAALVNPVDRLMAVDKAEHLHPIQLAHARRIAADHAHGVLLALRDTG